MLNMYTKSFDKAIKRYGFKKDQSGIFNRFQREKDNWEPHLSNSKRFILENISDNADSIAVLGSGWLLDFPIDELFNKNVKIDLYDLYHPKQILQFIKKWNNVNAIKSDLTGGLIEYLIFMRKNKEKVDIFSIEAFINEIQFDFNNYSCVVSLNIMSQLFQLIEDNILKESGLDINTENLRELIQRKHLESLPKNKSILISDFNENYLQKNKVVKTKRIIELTESLKAKVDEEWQWVFDTKKMYDAQYEVRMDVMAMTL
jgi:hypothetical protein